MCSVFMQYVLLYIPQDVSSKITKSTRNKAKKKVNNKFGF